MWRRLLSIPFYSPKANSTSMPNQMLKFQLTIAPKFQKAKPLGQRIVWPINNTLTPQLL